MGKTEKLIFRLAVVVLGIVILLSNNVFVYQTRKEPYQYKYYTTESFFAALNSKGEGEPTNIEEDYELNYGSIQSPGPPSGMGPWMLWTDPYYHYSNSQKPPIYSEYVYLTNSTENY